VPGTRDVVVVGGGIAGSALATVLARDGLDVLVLERQVTYRDKVRGETMQPWGVAEIMRLGLLDVLLDAGGGHGTRMVPYDEAMDPDVAEAFALPLDELLPDVPGSLNVGHPEACEAFTQAAVAAGATVVRGVRDMTISPGTTPTVGYAHEDAEHSVTCRLVVGADGRNSGVQRQLGVEAHTTSATTIGSGMLVDEVDGWPEHMEALGSEGDVHFLVFPRPGGKARLYLWFDIAQKGRFTGPDRQREFLDVFRLDCVPAAGSLAAARPAGPCASYPSTDTWTDRPTADGVVLIGDAAGWSDPIIGQGLAVAMRDTRTVADMLRGGDDWSPAAFDEYTEERAERMRRLRVTSKVATHLRCAFGPDGATRRQAMFEQAFADPLILGPFALAPLAGPETVEAEAFEPDNVERILAIA
jgi:2-polyprenyl-6-methoxyphenol hydroxylase-like FAD-dependent oxidoreductase